jgi:hypothetical protein
MLGDPAGDREQCDEGDRVGGAENGEGERSPHPPEQVRDDRVGGRHAAGLARSHQEARQRQLPDIGDEAGERRHQAPEGEAKGDDVAPVPAVRRPGDRDAQDRVEENEGEAGDQAERGVGGLHLRLDHRQSEAEDRTIEIVEHRDQAQEASV